MRYRLLALPAALAILIAPPVKAQSTARQSAAKTSTTARTPWGHPDLQGVWDYRTITPLERPQELAGREFLTDEEVAEFEQRAARRADGRPPEDERRSPSVHAPFWLDYGTKVIGTKRTSLVVDPPDGRVPSLTPEGKARRAARAEARKGRGPADSWEDRNLWERCITRGLPGGMLPAGYNNNIQVLQTPEYVAIVMEMIHDTRLIPIDGRAHLDSGIRQWHGDSRGRWEGNTLVVETTNFSNKTDFRGSGANLRLIERFTRADAETLLYEFTVEDPTTWERKWSAAVPMTRTVGPLYEYACHEGNYGLENILRVARTEEKATAEAAAKGAR